MTVAELATRFPEIPADLHDSEVLARFADTLEPLLAMAQRPSPCSTGHDASNHYYLKLIGPLSIYGYGLSTREKVEEQLQELLDRYAADPEAFAGSLLPDDVAASEVRGPGCE
jgi:hypothetical protein